MTNAVRTLIAIGLATGAGFATPSRAAFLDHWGECSPEEVAAGCVQEVKLGKVCHPLIGCDPVHRKYCSCPKLPEPDLAAWKAQCRSICTEDGFFVLRELKHYPGETSKPADRCIEYAPVYAPAEC
jgi:hypothetical protein